MSELTNNDYKNILEYYKKPIPISKRLIKMNAEKVIASKLCRCIKKVDKEHEARAIGICTKTIDCATQKNCAKVDPNKNFKIRNFVQKWNPLQKFQRPMLTTHRQSTGIFKKNK